MSTGIERYQPACLRVLAVLTSHEPPGNAAVFVGVSAGFSANLLITGLDPLLAGLSTEGAQVLDPAYEVAATCNWWFMIASTLLLTAAGTAATRWLVEPRQTVPAATFEAESSTVEGDRAAEDRGLRFAGGAPMPRRPARPGPGVGGRARRAG